MKAISNSGIRTYQYIFPGLLMMLFAGICKQVAAQPPTPPSAERPVATELLPGKGPAAFDFFYAGEAKSRNMYIVRNGKITWSYTDTTGTGEISDAVLMTNGNILFAHQFGITLIDKDKKIIWNYETPKNHETHTAQPIGKDHVVFVQNGDTAKLFVINIRTNKIVKEFPLPIKNPKSVHGQFRHARLTASGTMLVAHMDMGQVREYDINGKELLSLDAPGVWSAEPLKNGNILIAGHQGGSGYVRELNRKGGVVWECSLADLPYKMPEVQIATRLSNGNTIVNNWFNQWSGEINPDSLPVQAIAITPAKKIVWVLRSWAEPLNLGPSTTIQLLNDRNSLSEKVYFGDIK